MTDSRPTCETAQYAAAVTMTKDVRAGVLNIMTHLSFHHARSVAEAKGEAVTRAMNANPEHSVFSIACAPVPTPAALAEDHTNAPR